MTWFDKRGFRSFVNRALTGPTCLISPASDTNVACDYWVTDGCAAYRAPVPQIAAILPHDMAVIQQCPEALGWTIEKGAEPIQRSALHDVVVGMAAGTGDPVPARPTNVLVDHWSGPKHGEFRCRILIPDYPEGQDLGTTPPVFVDEQYMQPLGDPRAWRYTFAPADTLGGFAVAVYRDTGASRPEVDDLRAIIMPMQHSRPRDLDAITAILDAAGVTASA